MRIEMFFKFIKNKDNKKLGNSGASFETCKNSIKFKEI